MISLHNRKLQKTNRFSSDIKKIPNNIQISAYDILMKLTENIFHPELKIKKLKGFDGIYRIIVEKDYRIIYSFDGENIYLLRIAHRKDIYRKFEI